MRRNVRAEAESQPSKAGDATAPRVGRRELVGAAAGVFAVAFLADDREAFAASGGLLNFTGTWQPLTPYNQFDAVTYNGGFYVAQSIFISGASFDPTEWTQIVGQIGTYVPINQTIGPGGPAFSQNVLTIFPSVPGFGPFALAELETTFNGVVDPHIQFGYNIGTVGTVNSEPQLHLGFEVNYNYLGNNNTVEAYIQFNMPSGQFVQGGSVSAYRPFYWMIDRQTGLTTISRVVGDPFEVWDTATQRPNVHFSRASGNYISGTLSVYAVNHYGAYGHVDIAPGDSTTTGYISWLVGNGTRLGYMGASSSDIMLYLQSSGANFFVLGQDRSHTVRFFNNLTVLNSGQLKTVSANEATGIGSAALGSNSPAVTPSAPYSWLRFTTSDGSQVYVPAWK